MFRVTDDSGTVIFEDYIPRYNGIDIFITPPNEQHRRRIARVDFENKILFIERDSRIHTLKTANAYGLNHFVLSNGKKFTRVAIIEIDTGKIYLVETQFILKEGEFLIKKDGLQKQIFITREWISHYEVKEGEFKQSLIYSSQSKA